MTQIYTLQLVKEETKASGFCLATIEASKVQDKL